MYVIGAFAEVQNHALLTQDLNSMFHRQGFNYHHQKYPSLITSTLSKNVTIHADHL